MTNTDFAENQTKIFAIAELTLEVERVDELLEFALASPSPELGDLVIAFAAWQRSVARALAGLDATTTEG